ncbi:hypothetical protein M433DRAFT_539797, partial [Acidomyces richmondensis BFW]
CHIYKVPQRLRISSRLGKSWQCFPADRIRSTVQSQRIENGSPDLCSSGAMVRPTQAKRTCSETRLDIEELVPKDELKSFGFTNKMEVVNENSGLDGDFISSVSICKNVHFKAFHIFVQFLVVEFIIFSRTDPPCKCNFARLFIVNRHIPHDRTISSWRTPQEACEE